MTIAFWGLCGGPVFRETNTCRCCYVVVRFTNAHHVLWVFLQFEVLIVGPSKDQTSLKEPKT